MIPFLPPPFFIRLLSKQSLCKVRKTLIHQSLIFISFNRKKGRSHTTPSSVLLGDNNDCCPVGFSKRVSAKKSEAKKCVLLKCEILDTLFRKHLERNLTFLQLAPVLRYMELFMPKDEDNKNSRHQNSAGVQRSKLCWSMHTRIIMDTKDDTPPHWLLKIQEICELMGKQCLFLFSPPWNQLRDKE